MDSLSSVQQYQLEINGIKFWTPYWINRDGPPYRLGGAFKGKGTPAQILLALQPHLNAQNLKQPAQYRKLMRRHGLGIDCSGFVYHMLSNYLRSLGLRDLPHYLYVPRADILAASHKPSWQRARVAEAEIKAWPELVPMTKVCQRFHKSPRSCDSIAKAGDIKTGDMIKLTSGSGSDHLGIVVRVGQNRFEYAASNETWADGLGGPQISTLTITAPDLGLEAQDWPHRSIFDPDKGDAVWRLKALNR